MLIIRERGGGVKRKRHDVKEEKPRWKPGSVLDVWTILPDIWLPILLKKAYSTDHKTAGRTN